MSRNCAICGNQIEDAYDYAFCPDCRFDLQAMGCTDRHKLKSLPPPPPMCIGERGDTIDRAGVRRNSEGVVIGAPPTTEWRKAHYGISDRTALTMVIMFLAGVAIGLAIGMRVAP